TSELMQRATAMIEEIDALGGAVKSIETGFYQDRIAQSAYDWQRKVESKEEIVVGVNEFVTEELTPPETLRLDPALEREQIERLRSLRARRDQKRTDAALLAIEQSARNSENLMP